MTRRGRFRGSTAQTFLREAKGRPNLRVETEAQGGKLTAISRKSRARPGGCSSTWTRALSQVAAGLCESAAPSRIRRCPLIRHHRLAAVLGLLVVRSDQLPVGIPTGVVDQCVGDFSVQAATHARRRQLRGDLAQQLVTKSPPARAPRLEHSRVIELG